MTETEWLSCTDPEPMLAFLRGRATERKLRLFACACCRHVWSLLRDKRSRAAVAVAEQFADGIVGREELLLAQSDAWTAAAEAAFILTGAAAGARAADAGVDADDTATWGAVDRWGGAADTAWFRSALAMRDTIRTAQEAASDDSRRQQVDLLRVTFRSVAKSDTPGRAAACAWVEAARLIAEAIALPEQRAFRLGLAEKAAETVRVADAAGPDGWSGVCALAAWAAAEAAGDDAEAAAVSAEAVRLAAERAEGRDARQERCAQAELLREVFGDRC